MFNIFRKKSQVEELIKKDGIERATDRFAEIISKKLTSLEIASQFILEEIDGASKGNSASKRFAMNSGIHPEEYRGALQNSMPEIDGPDGPQNLLNALCFQITSNRELMAEFRCMIDDKIMQRFSLGKYGKEEDRTRQLLESLRNFLTDDRDVMPALTQNIPVLTDAPLRHVVNREKNIASAKRLIIELSKITGEETDSIIRKALEKGQEANRANEILSRLIDLSTSDSKKCATMQILSIEEGGKKLFGYPLSYEFHFSQEELDIANELNSELYDLMGGMVQMPTFPYREKKDVIKHGQGTSTTPGGDEYVGARKDGNMHGEGTFTWANGDEYAGAWEDGNMHGEGTFTYANGDEYVGAREEDVKHGQGTFTYANGDEYVGAFEGNVRHGQGTFTSASGDEYVGAFEGNVWHGQGTFTSASGEKYVGTWKDGILDN